MFSEQKRSNFILKISKGTTGATEMIDKLSSPESEQLLFYSNFSQVIPIILLIQITDL